MNGKSMLIVAATVFVLAVVSGVAISAQDKYTLKLPDGVPLSDWRGYGDWQLISTSKTDDRMKVILGNPTIIAAFKSGIPGNGNPFPEGSKIAKIQWKAKKSAEAPYAVLVPDTMKDMLLIVKDSKRFPDTGGWGYAQFNYDPASDTFSPEGAGAKCGAACHTIVKAKDYIFTAYPKR